MHDHRYEALGKPVFEDLEPGYFTRVQSLTLSFFSDMRIWNLVVLHGYKAKRYKEQICSRFGTLLFIIRIDFEIITFFIGYLDIKADFAAFNLFTN